MKKAMMIAAMVAVIGMANSAMAGQYNTDCNADNLNFFDAASWSPNGLPGAADSVRLGEVGTSPGVGSMIYDPATQSPGNEALYQVACNAGTSFYLGRSTADNEGHFYQESGNLEITGSWLDFAPGLGIWFLNGGSLKVGSLYFEPGGALGADSSFRFGAGTDAVLYVDTSRSGSYAQTQAGMLTAISDGRIRDLGGEGFIVTEGMGPGGLYTEVKLATPAGGVIPEPAGLGLIGLALLAVRRKRS